MPFRATRLWRKGIRRLAAPPAQAKSMMVKTHDRAAGAMNRDKNAASILVQMAA
jgi:hypothetical protein